MTDPLAEGILRYHEEWWEPSDRSLDSIHRADAEDCLATGECARIRAAFAAPAVDVYRPILEDAVREMEVQGLAVAASYREWLSDPAGFRPYAELAKSLRSLTKGETS